VNLADQICARLGIGAREPNESVDVAQCPGALVLKLDQNQIDMALEEVEEVFATNRDSFFS